MHAQVLITTTKPVVRPPWIHDPHGYMKRYGIKVLLAIVAAVLMSVILLLVMGIVSDSRWKNHHELLVFNDPSPPIKTALFQPKRSIDPTTIEVKVRLKYGRKLDEVINLQVLSTATSVSNYGVVCRSDTRLEIHGTLPLRHMLKPWLVGMIPQSCMRLEMSIYNMTLTTGVWLSASMKDGILAITDLRGDGICLRPEKRH